MNGAVDRIQRESVHPDGRRTWRSRYRTPSDRRLRRRQDQRGVSQALGAPTARSSCGGESTQARVPLTLFVRATRDVQTPPRASRVAAAAAVAVTTRRLAPG